MRKATRHCDAYFANALSNHTGSALAESLEAIDDGGNPSSSVDQERVECTHEHHSLNEAGRPSLQIRTLHHENGRAPSELDQREDAEESIRGARGRGEPRWPQGSILIEQVSRRLGVSLRECRDRSQKQIDAKQCTRYQRPLSGATSNRLDIFSDRP